MKKKLRNLILAFLLLIPFRLPISILFIEALNWISLSAKDDIPMNALALNVMVTKIIYNISLSAWFVYGIEALSRESVTIYQLQQK